jgi:hypothetical protein
LKKWLSTAAWMIALVLLLLSHSTIVNAYGTEVTGSVPFSVFNVAVSSITSSVAFITWDTNYDSTSQVFYGPSAGGYTNWTAIADSSPGVSHHTVVLSGLSPATTYHYHVQSTMDNFAITAVSEDRTFITSADGSANGGSGGGGGGGGGGSAGAASAGRLILTTSGLVPSGNLSLSSSGVAQNNVQLVTQDHTTQLAIANGTVLMDANNRPLTQIYANPLTTMPGSPPEGTVVLAYEFGPSGSRFNPPLTLTLSYEAAGLPGNTPEDLLHIIFWEGTQWVEIASTVDTSTHTVSAKLSHFSVYVLMKETAPSAPAPSNTAPASLTTHLAASPTPAALLINTPVSTPLMIQTPAPVYSRPAPAANPAASPAPSRTEASPSGPSSSSSFPVILLIYMSVFVLTAGTIITFVLKQARSGRNFEK